MSSSFPVIPLRDLVVFPTTMVPLYIGREKSIGALVKATLEKTPVLLLTQKNAKDSNPLPDELYSIGTLCEIIQTVNFPDGTVKIIVEGKEAVRATHISDDGECIIAATETIKKKTGVGSEMRASMKSIQTAMEELARLDKRVSTEALAQVSAAKTAMQLAYVVAANLNVKLEQKQEMLGSESQQALLDLVLGAIMGEIEVIKVEKKIQNRVKKSMEKSQKEYYLNEQMEAIQKELGNKDENTGELEEMLEKARTRGLSQEADKKAVKEIKKLKMMNPIGAEAAVIRNYVETLLALPWGDYTEEQRDISIAQQRLDEDHFGLEKVKDRILEQLAVLQLNPEARGTIICLSGPPGVGKCLGKDTPIIMYDGRTKMVQDIVVGDLLMGDDSTPRTVISTVKGRDKMFKIKQNNGNDYVVNSVHILSLKGSSSENGKYNIENKIDISLPEYLTKSDDFKKRMKGYKVPVEFNKKDLKLNPYLLGYWLGNGTSSSPNITFNVEHKSVINKIESLTGEMGTKAKVYQQKGGALTVAYTTERGQPNHFLESLQGYEVINNKHIPYVFLTSNREDRLSLLAGLIDSDGNLVKPGCYEIIQKNKILAEQIVFLSRSLGFKTSINESFKSCQDFEGAIYQRIHINGDDFSELPLLFDYKKCGKVERQRWYDLTEISVEEMGEGDYYGFEIDGNKRFLLSDFTVTHNTSLAKSVAEAQNRPFVRVSLGGVRDEAEITGHRRTYVGAMPGKIINAFKKAEKGNPVILLDEIDKMSSDHKGDPASAMLEVLDPSQNKTFQDHFLEVEYDLSKVLFFATANYIENIPRPLLDRMEVIRLEGYTNEEKLAIAKKYLLPKQLKEAGLGAFKVTMKDETLAHMIQAYTREAGVRNLERTIGKFARKIAKQVVTMKNIKVKSFTITKKSLSAYLGPAKFTEETISKENEIGCVNGMAWTEAGGDLLPIEVVVMPGKGGVQITGKLGEVMKESALTAVSYIRSRASLFDIDDDVFQKNDIHLHVPEGAVPKDGPSAGITIVTSIVSALTKIPVKRTVAMTGEVTLRGKVLPIGGLKEKVLAAARAGVTHIICPKENEKDIVDIPEEVRKTLDIFCASHVDEVLVRALDISAPKDLFKLTVNREKSIRSKYE